MSTTSQSSAPGLIQPQQQPAVFISSLPPRPELQARWLHLQAQSDAGFFLRWAWIGSWLDMVRASGVAPLLIEARLGEQTVGLALGCVARGQGRVNCLRKALYLHETGQQALDVVTIEYNGFLLHRMHADGAAAAMAAALRDRRHPWSQIVIRRAETAPVEALSAQGIWPGRSVPVASWRVDLGEVRAQPGGYLALLSAGRRQHIRRCLRACQAFGPLSLSTARTEDEVLHGLARLLHWHRLRWDGQDRRASDFATPAAQHFHLAVARAALREGSLRLLRVAAGVHEVGYLYCFVHAGQVLFYQSGYNYQLLDHRFSPGLVSLSLAIEHLAHEGHTCFDFLAGERLYKSSLAQPVPDAMVHVSAFRSGAALRLDACARHGAARLRHMLGGLESAQMPVRATAVTPAPLRSLNGDLPD
jgi:CelD/BcsL family acetyltransferase involved in cellulose biosynthesis